MCGEDSGQGDKSHSRPICPNSLTAYTWKKSLVNKRPLSPVTSSCFTLSRYPLVTGWKYFGTERPRRSLPQAPRTQHFSLGVKAAARTGVSVSQLAFHIS